MHLWQSNAYNRFITEKKGVFLQPSFNFREKIFIKIQQSFNKKTRAIISMRFVEYFTFKTDTFQMYIQLLTSEILPGDMYDKLRLLKQA